MQGSGLASQVPQHHWVARKKSLSASHFQSSRGVDVRHSEIGDVGLKWSIHSPNCPYPGYWEEMNPIRSNWALFIASKILKLTDLVNYQTVQIMYWVNQEIFSRCFAIALITYGWIVTLIYTGRGQQWGVSVLLYVGVKPWKSLKKTQGMHKHQSPKKKVQINYLHKVQGWGLNTRCCRVTVYSLVLFVCCTFLFLSCSYCSYYREHRQHSLKSILFDAYCVENFL